MLGDDPTVNALQERVADLFGKEAACFVPSGTMANQTAIRALTEPGDEIIAHETAHIFHHETGAPAALSGCTLRFARTAQGRFDADDLTALVRPYHDVHEPLTKLVVIENTSNLAGGTVWPIDTVRRVADRARTHNLRVHIDGARIWNASVASGVSLRDYGACADTLSCCFSKGLGAPVGSAVVGSRAVIARVFRFRKMFGGAMRQAGILAAAALYALDHHVDRLADDHARAKKLADALAELPAVTTDPDGIETNLVYLDFSESAPPARDIARRLAENGVLVLDTAPRQIRAVTHLHITDADIGRTIDAFRAALASH